MQQLLCDFWEQKRTVLDIRIFAGSPMQEKDKHTKKTKSSYNPSSSIHVAHVRSCGVLEVLLCQLKLALYRQDGRVFVFAYLAPNGNNILVTRCVWIGLRSRECRRFGSCYVWSLASFRFYGVFYKFAKLFYRRNTVVVLDLLTV
jgi:hypothetical protein